MSLRGKLRYQARGAPSLTRDDPTAFAPPSAFGPFRVLHQIGVGALGPVFRTYEPTRDRLVAVKVFRLDITPEQARALADELSRATEAGLFHPSIVEPIAAGVEGTVAYRAEEYVAAESLDVAMRHYAPAALDKALPFITQLAGALDFARAAGIGHGALHPRDIFVTPDEARATGFGVVEALERVGLRAPVRRPYSAPERIAGEAWSTPADVFALAAIAYELLTGRRPSGTGDQIGPLSAPTLGKREVSVRAVLARAMHDVPARRYPAALAFASALEAAAHDEQTMPDVGAIGTTSAVSAATIPLEPTTGAAASNKATAADQIEPRTFEPVEAEASAADVRTANEELDDIAAEREEDEAHYELSRRELAADDTERSLFDEEAEADSAFVKAEPKRFADEFAVEEGEIDDAVPAVAALDDEIREAEPAEEEETVAEDPRVFASVEDEFREDPRAAASIKQPPGHARSSEPEYRRGTAPDYFTLEERPRPAMLALTLMLMIGLLLGFVAGYALGGRDADTPTTAAVPSTAPPSATSPQPSAPPDRGRAFSEHPASQLPATPPTIPQEASSSDTGRAETAAAAPSRQPATGRIVVRSTPSAAGVTVNGRWSGRTPLTLDGVRFGPYTIRVVEPGFAVAREEFTLSASEPSRTVSVTLAKQPATPSQGRAAPTRPTSGVSAGSLYVDSRPRGARVMLDGQFVGTTPLRLGDVSAGSHVVRLELVDHQPWTTSVQVVGGQDVQVRGSLEPIR